MSGTVSFRALDLRALSERYLAAWKARDPNAIAALHTADTVFELHAGGEPARGREGARAAFAEIFQRFPQFGIAVRRTLFGERHWVLDWTLTAERDGQQVRLDCLDVVALARDGLVARKDTYLDAAQLQSLGEGS